MNTAVLASAVSRSVRAAVSAPRLTPDALIHIEALASAAGLRMPKLDRASTLSGTAAKLAAIDASYSFTCKPTVRTLGALCRALHALHALPGLDKRRAVVPTSDRAPEPASPVLRYAPADALLWQTSPPCGTEPSSAVQALQHGQRATTALVSHVERTARKTRNVGDAVGSSGPVALYRLPASIRTTPVHSARCAPVSVVPIARTVADTAYVCIIAQTEILSDSDKTLKLSDSDKIGPVFDSPLLSGPDKTRKLSASDKNVKRRALRTKLRIAQAMADAAAADAEKRAAELAAFTAELKKISRLR